MNWRTVFALLLAANLGYFVWAKGMLAPFGITPVEQHEPERLDSQLRPEALRIGNITGTNLGGAAQYSCLRAGLIPKEQIAAVRLAAENALPEGSWRLLSLNLPERWIVYMGKYSSVEAVQRKKQELARLGITQLLPLPQRLQPGLSLAASSGKAQAEAKLSEFGARGVRTARVIQQQAGVNGAYIQLDRVSPSMQLQLEALEPALQGMDWQVCD